ncbi:uncharacterized protein LOC143354598 [Halictus rubicundus]|uniref:uncharacterized protein LOC143354598 n=1 Tax=Halictus rubicundus TaxID=77578 RepID=UPI004037074B
MLAREGRALAKGDLDSQCPRWSVIVRRSSGPVRGTVIVKSVCERITKKKKNTSTSRGFWWTCGSLESLPSSWVLLRSLQVTLLSAASVPVETCRASDHGVGTLRSRCRVIGVESRVFDVAEVLLSIGSPRSSYRQLRWQASRHRRDLASGNALTRRR